jgi:hypothetical protein
MPAPLSGGIRMMAAPQLRRAAKAALCRRTRLAGRLSPTAGVP